MDFPGRVSTVVFVQGCPWRCGYCHNPHLQPRSGRDTGWASVRSLLARRRGLVDAVVFSGGEPTSDPALVPAIKEVREQGFAAGLHTAGIYPPRLERALREVDWVGIDVKAPFERYAAVTGVAGSGVAARKSLQAVLDADCAYEVRMTLHPALATAGDVRELAGSLVAMGVRHFALQRFRSRGCANPAMRTGARAWEPDAALLAELTAAFPSFTYRDAA
ncbi:anaerobic ribonucleoside-triphosphate reductase activating protein [Usitatibacter palustris]|uniref:anaerobic ribonucleoside-triphosphate reductase activating protein n=1 Tax=Usitatibacter palustris TaxID=2732487 RepID=UPI001BB1B632